MPKHPRRLLGLLLTSAVGIVLAAGCTAGQEASSGGDERLVSAEHQVVTFPDGEREPLPDLAAKTLDGERLDLASLRGKIIVINIWGSWCAPCRAEAPNLEKVWRDTKDRGVQFVGINTRDTEAGARAFERNFGITYPSLLDPHGELQLEFRGKLAARTIPTTYFVDRDGTVAAKATGGLTEQRLRETLRPLL